MSILECEDEQIGEMPEKKWKRENRSLYKNPRKQMHNIKKPIFHMHEKFCQEKEILKRKQVKILKTSI